MTNYIATSDKAAIGLSILCTVHCLALPVLITLSPSLATLPLADEAWHFWMVLAVLPISAFALTLGCKKHNRKNILFTGIVGLVVLALSVLLGEDYLGHEGEKILTVLGSVIIATSHIFNFKQCRKQTKNCCPSESKSNN